MRADKVREGPRLEKLKHREAEERIRASVLRREQGLEWCYEGRDDDLSLIQRKGRELGPERLRRVVEGEAWL